MDGTLAMIFAIVGLSDMVLNDCPTGCLAERPADRRLSFQASGVQFQDDWIGSELVLGYEYDRRFGPFQPLASVSFTEEGDVWIGGGVKWRYALGQSDFFVDGSFQPGLWARNDGPDLGGVLQFRSALGLGYAFTDQSAVVVSFDHRSNGDTQSVNPGLETLSIQYSMTLD
ncbi:acyloxyacyl hydrolase [Thalassorhabdomicrobium marinisediminis]|uniref:Acyloxyacyl hydrolase n=1 Tax=Thalassorhabdomicrobium marinisediminis TaxID=2170577 RepID=A0A2T7FUX0_9RHOB|nr:acyloxyacyl hydrolase [Thalassorhabdomicrobium marinisediminis]PVA05958.1 acyloxyacyl hydrolase [Thalassorhabdomicrobium marinisediminis]